MASTINGIEINPIICNKIMSWGIASRGVVQSQGSGNDITNHMIASNAIVWARFFLLGSIL
jgi:hypothetical protein